MKCFILILASTAAFAQPATYEIKPAPGSRFSLEVFKTGLMSGKKHLFVFERYHGTLTYDPKAPEKSKAELTVETGSIVLKDQWLDAKDFKEVHAYAIGEKMLEVAKHPSMRFVSGAIKPRPDGGFDAHGTLTIRGVPKPVVLAVTPKLEGNTIHLTGKAEVRLKDYDLKRPSAALGAVGTKNEMAVSFVVSGAKR